MVRKLLMKNSCEDLFSSHVCESTKTPMKAANQCIVFCKKMAPNVFDIKKGLAVIRRMETGFNDGVCMIAPETKVVFVFE